MASKTAGFPSVNHNISIKWQLDILLFCYTSTLLLSASSLLCMHVSYINPSYATNDRKITEKERVRMIAMLSKMDLEMALENDSKNKMIVYMMVS
jgi:hypothetical protein